MRVFPFAALRPAPGCEQEVASVPYDVVDAAEARDLAAGNPNSFLHVVRSEIDLPAGTNPYDDAVYAQARSALDRLVNESVLIRDDSPRMYLYAQTWRGARQVGLVCCGHLDDYENNIIKKHEKTRKVKEDDRTRHVLATNANTGPVFLTYRDESAIDALVARDNSGGPIYHFTAPDGVEHTVWAVDDWRPYAEAFARVPFTYVADGHHRSASAWRAGQERRKANPNHSGEEEYNRFLIVLFPASHLRILPYNRIVRDLNGLSVAEFESKLREVGALERVSDANVLQPTKPGVFGIITREAEWILTLDPESIDRSDPIASLDVALLQDRVLTPILAIGDPREDDRIDFVGGIRGVDHLRRLIGNLPSPSGRGAGGEGSSSSAAAFIMHPTSIEQLMAVADANLVMPPKSTWFEPKLRSGLLVHMLD